MIPRHQKIIFAILLLASLAMGVLLWQLRDRAHQRLVAGEDSSPTQAPEVAPAEQITLLVANDAYNSLLPQVHSLPLPKDPGARARAVLGKLLDLYASSRRNPPCPRRRRLHRSGLSSAGHGQRARGFSTAIPPPKHNRQTGPQLAVINLTGAFAAGHPSGLETETLTVLSICGTLHANLPRVTQVRFLVDGQQHATLAGHADLTRTYLTDEAGPAEPVHP